MNYGLVDFLGIVGVGIIVVTYLFLQLGKLSSTALAYSLMNAIGASLIVASLLVNFNLSALLMEVFWVLISLLGVYRYFRFKTLSHDNN
jgi:hypothetical protein